MSKTTVYIEARDCLPFEKTPPQQVLNDFITEHRDKVFWFSAQNKLTQDNHLAEYDYRRGCWCAGRFIGEASLEDDHNRYQISIKPRFGNAVFFRMLEEIHNIKITKSLSAYQKSDNWGGLVKKVIAFIWLGKLAAANLHGLPKTQVKIKHVGHMIKGIIHVRQSIPKYYTNQQLVSYRREKFIDDSIAQIIFQAYHILKDDLSALSGKVPDTAQDAIDQVFSQINQRRFVSRREYQNIKYKDIYNSWRPLVEFSWDIIQKHHQKMESSAARKGFGFFIDMAEIWEQYLRSLLKKNLVPMGWRLLDNQLRVYPGTFFSRLMIPDIIFEKEQRLLLWDAKYKQMEGRFFDLDREDFFQIHTYIQYYAKGKVVLAGGLLYPLAKPLADAKSPYLLTPENIGTTFLIDGVELRDQADINEDQDIAQMEQAFLQRVNDLLE